MSQTIEGTRRAKNPALPAVLQCVKHDTRALLGERIKALFMSADDALFEMADRANSDADQNLYFDSMRVVRLQRASIQQKFIDNYSKSWNALLQSDKPEPAPRSSLELAAEDFSLLENDELEVTVAAAGISSKVTTMFLLPITQLTRRLETVCEQDIRPELNPLGPQCLNQDFIRAIETLDVHIRIRIILLKLFERFVAEQLEPVFEQANQILIDAGVLPDLRDTAGASAGTSEANSRAVPATEGAGPNAENVESHSLKPTSHSAPPLHNGTAAPTATRTDVGAVVREVEEFLQLQALLSGARASGANGVSSATARYRSEDHGPATLVSTPELMEVLGIVQGSASAAPIDLEVPAEVLDLRGVLLESAAQVTGEPAAALEDSSEDVVDLVQMLFDYILNDNNLAIPMKALIGRLQIPLLKVAIIDRTFFANAAHPARQLLNELAAAGIGWSSAAELKRDETYNKIESIVLRVMNGFSDDLTLFSNLIAELRHFAGQEKKKRNQVEQRVRETEQGKARTREAKQTVQTLINQRACGLRLPAQTGHFVSDTWSRVLVYLFVTQGPDSEAWVEAVETLDDLLWAVQPLNNDADLKAREQLLPRLLTQLEAGITHANLPESQEQLALLQATVEEIHRNDLEFLEGVKEDPAPEILSTELPELVLVPSTGTDTSVEPPSPDALAAAEALAPGHWLELLDDNDAVIRCKLATIAENDQRCVFVNRKGMKVCERSVMELAQAFDSETVRVLDESELFDRALEAVIGNLRTMQASAQR